MSADPAIPAAKVEACVEALLHEESTLRLSLVGTVRDYSRERVRAVLRAAAAYDAQQRAAAGPRPVRERDTDAWWAD